MVKVAFKWGGAAETRTARTNPDSYMIRYSTDLYGLIDDFQSAKEPLEGTGTAPGSATEPVVSLPYAELVTREVYLSVAAERKGVVGPPATAIAVTINEKTTTTTTTTTTTSTTTTTHQTTTSTTTTPEETTTTEGTTGEATTTPPMTTTDSASANALCQLLFPAVVLAFLTLR
nr:integumentary mucin C.1-like [Penaeus vannamei]